MKRTIVLIFAILLSFSYNGYPKTDAKWELVKTDNGITVYKRPCPGSSYDEVFATADMDVSMEVLAGTLSDVDAQTQWMTRCKEARIVKEINELDKVLYYYFNSPWPVEDRDVVVTAAAEINAETARVVIKGHAICEPSVPPQKTCIRIVEMTSAWILECDVKDRNKTRVYFTATGNPAGLIPAFIVNYQMKNDPFQTFETLRKLTKEKKYIELGNKSPGKSFMDKLYSNPDLIKKVVENRKKITPEMMMKQ